MGVALCFCQIVSTQCPPHWRLTVKDRCSEVALEFGTCAVVISIVCARREVLSFVGEELRHTAGCCRVHVGLWVLPFRQQFLCLSQKFLQRLGSAVVARLICDVCRGITHSLLSGVRHRSVGLEQRADIQSLASPEVAMNSPVESQLQRTPVQRPVVMTISITAPPSLGRPSSTTSGAGAHSAA